MLLPLLLLVAETSTSSVAQTQARSLAAFSTVYDVLQDPRCRNCHPDGDRPLHGDPPVPHKMNVQRRLVEVGMACATCHQTKNTPGRNKPPGAPHWGLAPREQVFVGRTEAQLCEQLKNPATNGNKTLAALKHHLIEDPLVLWGWNPGEGREPVRVPQPIFALAVDEWIDNGAHCPKEAP